MTDPVQEIRERVAVVQAFRSLPPEERVESQDVRAYVAFLSSAADDMQLLLERIEELEKRVRMYEVVKS